MVLALVLFKGEDLTNGEGVLISLADIKEIEKDVDFHVEIV